MKEKVNVSQTEKKHGSHRLQCSLSCLAGAGKSHWALSACLPTSFTTPRIAVKLRRFVPTAKGGCLKLPLPASHVLPTRRSSGKKAAAAGLHRACPISVLSCVSRDILATSYLRWSAGGQCVDVPYVTCSMFIQCSM